MNRQKRRAPVGPPSVCADKDQEQQEEASEQQVEKADEAAEKRIRMVRLRQNEAHSGKLGFSLRGGKDAGTGCSVGVFVCQVERHSEARRRGLRIGDQLIQVNGLRVSCASYDEVIGLIKRTPRSDDIHLMVASAGRIPFQERAGDPIRWLPVPAQHSSRSLSSPSSTSSSSDENGESVAPEKGELLLLRLKEDAAPSSEDPNHDEGLASYESKRSSSSSSSSSSRSSTGQAKLRSETATTATTTDSQLSSSCSLSLSSSSSLASSASTGGDVDRKQPLTEVQVAGGRRSTEPFGCGVVKGPSEWPGIFVQTVRAGSLAERSRLEPGDQLVRAQGHQLDALPFDEAIGLIKRLQREQETLVLLVRKGAALRHLARGLLCCQQQPASTPTSKATPPLPVQWSEKEEDEEEDGQPAQRAATVAAAAAKPNPISCDGTQSQLSGKRPPVADNKLEQKCSNSVASSGGHQARQAPPPQPPPPAARTKPPQLARLAEHENELEEEPAKIKRKEDEDEDGEQIRIVSQNCKLHQYQSSQFHKSHLLLEKFPPSQRHLLLTSPRRTAASSMSAATAAVPAAPARQRPPPATGAGQQQRPPPAPLRQQQQQPRRHLSTDNLSCLAVQQQHHYRPLRLQSARPVECCTQPPGSAYGRSSSVMGQPTCCGQLASRPPCCRPAPSQVSATSRCHQQQQQRQLVSHLHRAPPAPVRARSMDRLNMSISLSYLSIHSQQQHHLHQYQQQQQQQHVQQMRAANIKQRRSLQLMAADQRLTGDCCSLQLAPTMALAPPTGCHQARRPACRRAETLLRPSGNQCCVMTTPSSGGCCCAPLVAPLVPAQMAAACCCLPATNRATRPSRQFNLPPAGPQRRRPCASCCGPPSKDCGAATDSSGYLSAGPQATPIGTSRPQLQQVGAIAKQRTNRHLSTFGPHHHHQQREPPTNMDKLAAKETNEASTAATTTCCSLSSSASPPSSSAASTSAYSPGASPDLSPASSLSELSATSHQQSPKVLAAGNRRAPAPPPCPPPPPAPDAELDARIGAALRQHRKGQQRLASHSPVSMSLASDNNKEPTQNGRLCFVDELKMLARRSTGSGDQKQQQQQQQTDSSTLIKIINAARHQQRATAATCSCKPAASSQSNNHLCAAHHKPAPGKLCPAHDNSNGGQSKSVKKLALDEEHSKRRQHEMLMKEFKSAHSRMFKRRNAEAAAAMDNQNQDQDQQTATGAGEATAAVVAEQVRLIRTSLAKGAKPFKEAAAPQHLAAAN